jgi:tRNA nucleotidyltransferase (CCA-adding enzyme)
LNLIKTIQSRFELYEFLEGYLAESVLIASVCNDDPAVEEKINLFETELKDIKIYTTGKDLIEAGLIPGPVFGEIFRDLLQAKVNKKISSKEDEEEYIKKFISKKFLN